MTIQIDAIDKCFPLVLLITPDKVVRTFESVDIILKCNYSHESSLPLSLMVGSFSIFFQNKLPLKMMLLVAGVTSSEP